MYSLKGTLKVKNEIQEISEKFKKREFVLEDSSTEYTQVIKFQLANDNCSKIDVVNIGDEITAYFNLRGREWTNKEGKVMYFNTLDCWRIESGAGSGTTTAAPTSTPAAQPDLSEEDDLPF